MDAEMADNYQMLEQLGSGSFGVVYKALEKSTGEFVAIKHIDLEGSDDDIREIQQEISLLATCSSEYVTRYKASFVRGVKLWIVMEYLGGGSCLDLLQPGPLSEEYIAIVLRELLHGLDYLHGSGKIHRDIKAANILLSEKGRVKIADFGVAAQLTNIKSQRLTFVGTPFWMAPEVIQEYGYDFHADIWSLGITAMEMALGEPPRSEVHPMKVLFLIPKEKPPRLEGNRWSREFKDFVALCLNKDAEKRPTARALLKHPFIARAGKVEVLKGLVQKVKQWEQSGARREKTPKYYEETLREMNNLQEDDEWVFETIKPTQTVRALVGTQRLVSRPNAERGQDGMSKATSAMEGLSLDNAPLGTIKSAGGTMRRAQSTITTPKPRHASPRVATARKVSVVSPAARRSSRRSSGATPTARRVSARQPLGVDMSFGNSPSTVRQFKRVPSEHKSAVQAQSVVSPQDSVIDSDAENRPPISTVLRPPPTPATNKEGLLGRRSFANCVDPAFQECYASTGDRTKREALGRVAEAWAELDSGDPEGELILLKAIVDRIQMDPKLASVLLPQRMAAAQADSMRMSRKNSQRGTSTNRDVTPHSSPSKAKRVSEGSSYSPTKSGGSSSPSKLVLNPLNPHLKKMRSNQQLQAEKEKEKEKAALEDKMPGKIEKDMEHVGMLADVLYGRWTEGLRSRWPQT
ncbi:Pkinase-domain-containing protein [Piedraia hortae CBS 480.64]|uniref:non-specific serine/threonine protein kinase n=1 Tax=Piedraia hortae CBS 480.64 TaxID=1314780 RepID=A0A6A7BYG9_9PEZI|nr:Pkinase-domain-containing protein [Piedraia hortae CBS 480.64]